MEEQTVSGIWLGTTENFQGSYKTFSLNTGRVVTRKQKILETPMPTWVIQHVEEISINGGQDIAKDNEQLFVDQFSKNNDFAAALHEGGIKGVAQDDDDQNDNDDSNTDEDS